ncbi:MAG: phage holin [Coriobacteriia bacterium]|nr:phage holin [Coriobacteriia bacterium]
MKARPTLSNTLYNILKWLAILAIPACGTAYLALSKVWGLPHGIEIAETCIIAQTLLGALLGISTANYNANKFDESESKSTEGTD